MTDAQEHTEGWEMLPWKQFERTIFRLQKRIYKATQRGDFKRGAPWAPQLTTAAASFVFSTMSGCTQSDTRQPWQTNPWGRRHRQNRPTGSDAHGTNATESAPASVTDTKGLHPKT